MRILLVSDIHANLAAFEAVLEDAQGDWDCVWCLGDLVGYGPDPNECIEQLRDLPHVCLAGDQDWAAVGRVSLQAYLTAVDAHAVLLWTSHRLTQDNRAYLEALPVRLTVGEYTLIHASPRDSLSEYILDRSTAQINFYEFDTLYACFGHTHQPIMYLLGADGDVTVSSLTLRQAYKLGRQRHLINPGSVGQPRDQNPDAAYGILNLKARTFEQRRVAYNIQAVQQRMRAAELPERTILRLAHGW